jgi:transcriptional regulator with XRE-family HTH domain
VSRLKKPPKVPAKMPHRAAEIARRIEGRGISVHAVAVRLGVDPRHLRRVLSGERPGSAALLESMAEVVEALPGRTPQEQEERLINAAVHIFFLKRGAFDSEICRAAPVPGTADRKGGGG